MDCWVLNCRCRFLSQLQMCWYREYEGDTEEAVTFFLCASLDGVWLGFWWAVICPSRTLRGVIHCFCLSWISQGRPPEVWWPQHFSPQRKKTYCPYHKTLSEISRLVKRPWLEYEWWEKSRVVSTARVQAGENHPNCPCQLLSRKIKHSDRNFKRGKHSDEESMWNYAKQDSKNLSKG